MDDHEGNSDATESIMSTELIAISTFPIKNDSDTRSLEKNGQSHVSDECSLKKEKNDDSNSLEIHIASEELDHLGGTANIHLPELDYNDIDRIEYHCVTQLTYEPSYEPRKRKSSLAESDDSIDDDPEKKRVKCLQYIGLLIGGIFLSIIVIYYGRVDTEGFIDFDELRRLRNYT